MIYLLQDRFKGALLGALLGENLALNEGKLNFSLYQLSLALQLAIAGGESIINYKDLNIKSWLINLTNNQVSYGKFKTAMGSGETAIANIPVALFYYENLTNLTENLKLGINLWQDPSLPLENVLWWGYVIKIILENKFFPNQIISQIKGIMEEKQLVMPEILLQIDNYIEQKYSLHQVSKYLSRNCNYQEVAMAQALYCFATIPDDFRLCLQRTLKTTYQPQLTATLTSTLLGLYNGYSNIPLDWRFSLQESLWGKQIEILSENLVAVWCGVL